MSASEADTSLSGLRTDMRHIKSAVSRLEKSMCGVDAKLETILNFLYHFNNNRVSNGAEGRQGSEWKTSFSGASEEKVPMNSGKQLESLTDGTHSHIQNSQDSEDRELEPEDSDSDSSDQSYKEEARQELVKLQSVTASRPIGIVQGDNDGDTLSEQDINRDDKSLTEDLTLVNDETLECKPDFSGTKENLSMQQMAIHWDVTQTDVPYSMLRRNRTEPSDDNRVKILEEEGKQVKFDRKLSVEDGSIDLPSLREARILALEQHVTDQHKEPKDMSISDSQMEADEDQKEARMDEIQVQPQEKVEVVDQLEIVPGDNRNEYIEHVEEKLESTHVMENDGFGSMQEQSKVQVDFTQAHASFSSSTEKMPQTEEKEVCIISNEELQKFLLDEGAKATECKDPKSDGMDTILCVDTSASMAGPNLENVKIAITGFLDGLETSAVDHSLEENVALVTFGKETKVLQHLTNDYGCVRDVVDELEAGGPTPLVTGLCLCQMSLNGRGGVVQLGNYAIPPRIIIFTDGRVTQERQLKGQDRETGELDEEIKERLLYFSQTLTEEPRVITCVPVGDADQDTMELLTQMNAGKIVSLNQVPSLSRHFFLNTIIGKEIAESPKLKNKEVVIKKARQNYPGIGHDDVNFLTEQITLRFCDEQGELPNLPLFGSRVRRGDTWKWGDYDSHGLGTIIAHRGEGNVIVLWDNGQKGRYRFTKGKVCDVEEVNEPLVLYPGDPMAVGVQVKRGPDWKWGEQDGGNGTIGVVFRMSNNNTVLHVRWPNGKRGNYRYGYDKKYDVIACILDTPTVNGSVNNKTGIMTPTKDKVLWEWEDGDGNWTPYPPEINSSIETSYQKTPNSTKVMQLNDKMYRINISTHKQWPVNSQCKSDIQNIRRSVIPAGI
ncbi:hypothetical protein ScPMuIL_018187 [Solemya velum]